jgi:hypothetical protein
MLTSVYINFYLSIINYIIYIQPNKKGVGVVLTITILMLFTISALLLKVMAIQFSTLDIKTSQQSGLLFVAQFEVYHAITSKMIKSKKLIFRLSLRNISLFNIVELCESKSGCEFGYVLLYK